MQASRTAHYARLYRDRGGSQRSQGRGWPYEHLTKPPLTAAEPSASRPIAARARWPARAGDWAGEAALSGGVSATMARAARAHFIDTQVREAAQAGIQQMVWLVPHAFAASDHASNVDVGLDAGLAINVLPLEADALIDPALVRSARTLFVCDGLLDRTTPARVDAILRTIGDSCYGSRLAFVYLDAGLIGGSRKSRRPVPRLGESDALGLDARSLPSRLASVGLVLDADMGLPEYARRALGDSGGDLRDYGFCRVFTAHVRAPSPCEPRDPEAERESDTLN